MRRFPIYCRLSNDKNDVSLSFPIPPPTWTNAGPERSSMKIKNKFQDGILKGLAPLAQLGDDCELWNPRPFPHLSYFLRKTNIAFIKYRTIIDGSMVY